LGFYLKYVHLLVAGNKSLTLSINQFFNGLSPIINELPSVVKQTAFAHMMLAWQVHYGPFLGQRS